MRKYVMAVTASVGIMAAAAGVRAAGSAIPTVDTFRDAFVSDTVGNPVAWTDRIRSDSKDERKFWQGVRASPGQSARDIRGRMRSIDRRLADIEQYVTTENRSLAREIDELR